MIPKLGGTHIPPSNIIPPPKPMRLNSTKQIDEELGDYLILGYNGNGEGWSILDQYKTLEETIKSFGAATYVDQVIVKLVNVEIKEL